MKQKIAPLALAVSLLIQGAHSIANTSEAADKIFFGKHIHTMDSKQPKAEAVAIRGETIVFVGSKKEAKKFTGDSTELVELGDKTLVPGLIDAHGHFSMVAFMSDFVNASSPPVGKMTSIDDIVTELKAEIAKRGLKKGEWLYAYGYDDSLLKDNRHPTRADLDKVSTDVAIYMMHVSGHLGAFNTAAMTASGISKDTQNPEGGVFRRIGDSSEPNGVVEEAATHPFLMPLLSAKPDPQKFARQAVQAQTVFTQYGVTTIQDGAAMMAALKGYRQLGQSGLLGVDIGGYPVAINSNHSHAGHDSKPEKSSVHEYIEAYEKQYASNVRIAGVKFVLDGSPQGRTAWTTKPYKQGPEGAGDDYVAYPSTNVPAYKEAAKELLLAGVPILVHCNGDKAIDTMLDSVEEAFAGKEIPDHRSVIIHAQLMRPDQIDRAKKLKVIPSFYSAHPFFWGDWHRLSFGDERALHISPAGTALKKDVLFTIHNDSPIVPPDMMRLLWVAVNRETRSGFTLGKEERISPMEGLKAMTINAAYQYFEEDKKGSLTAGKQADLVILDQDPVKVDPKTIKDIKVLETIAHGKTVFKR